MRPHSKRIRQLALDLHEEYGLGPKAIGTRLGVPTSTVSRWVYPEYHARQLAASRAYKESHQGTCEQCGNKTWIGSKLCHACHNKKQHDDKYWTKERVIKAIQRWNDEHGQPPSARDWLHRGDYHPGMGGVYGTSGEFSSWADAIEAAGFPRPVPGWKKNDRRWDHQHAQQLRDLGVSDKQIAKKLGITETTLRRHLGPRRSREQRPIAANRFRTREQRIHDLQQAIQYDA